MGRSKKKSTRPVSQYDGMDFCENIYLKKKNSDLAKALADLKIKFANLNKEYDALYTKHLIVETQLKRFSNNVDKATKACLKKFVDASSDLARIIELTNENNNVEQKPQQQDVSPTLTPGSSSAKKNLTQAVKPMVGGHVIHRPTVNLQRVSTQELAQQIISRSSERFDYAEREEERENEEIQSININNLRQASVIIPRLNIKQYEDSLEEQNSSASLSATNSLRSNSITQQSKLNTIWEEREEETSSTSYVNHHFSLQASNPSPIISGYFKELRVYLSPTRLPSNSSPVRDKSTRFNSTGENIQTQSTKIAKERIENEERSANIKSPCVTSRRKLGCMTKNTTHRSNPIDSLISRNCNLSDNLIDNLEDEGEISKLQAMSVLGLQPKKLAAVTSTPITKEGSMKRRSYDRAETSTSSNEYETPKKFKASSKTEKEKVKGLKKLKSISPTSSRSKRSSLTPYTSKRKSLTPYSSKKKSSGLFSPKKKSNTTSSSESSPSINLSCENDINNSKHSGNQKKIFVTHRRGNKIRSISPQKTPQKRLSQTKKPTGKTFNTLRRKRFNKQNSFDNSSNEVVFQTSGEECSPKKENRTSKKIIVTEARTSTSFGRPKRTNTPISFKEPSLKKKLRRLK